METITERVLTTTQYAELIGLTKSKVIRMCKAGKIKGAFRLGKHWKIPYAGNAFVSRETFEELERKFISAIAIIESIHKQTEPNKQEGKLLHVKPIKTRKI